MILRALGIWLVIDGTGSISLRHRKWSEYTTPQKVFETVWRVARIVIGATLVMVSP